MSKKDFKDLAFLLGNIGAEVVRLLNWKKQQQDEQAKNSLYRALNLIDQAIEDTRWRGQRRELLILREVLCARAFDFDVYQIFDNHLIDYFLPFALVVRNEAK